MNDTYNANMYLIKSDLNTVENQIETLTEEIQENIFNNTTSPLRNIQVGDDLNGKTIYLNIPSNFYENITENVNTVIISTNNSNSITLYRDSYFSEEDFIWGIYITYKNKDFYLYHYTTDSENDVSELHTNKKRFKLPMDFGIVTAIDTNNDGYQYIKIYNDQRIIPNYVKHTWVDNEFLSMQKIDNIEQGIKNIGEYYYKPQGWLNSREWLKISNINTDNKDMNIQNISYSDLNRWLTDLNLIDFDNLDKMTIWNSTISEIDWNKQNDTEWEDL